MVGTGRALNRSALTTFLIVVAAIVLRGWLIREASGAHAVPSPTIEAAVQQMTKPLRPFSAVQDPSRPFLPSFLVRGVYEASILVGKPFSDRYALRSAFEAGSAFPVRIAQAVWAGMEILLVVALVPLARRALRGRDSWRFFPAALLAISPLGLGGMTAVDGGTLAALLLACAFLLLGREPHVFRLVGAGILVGLAAAAAPFALAFLPGFVVSVATDARAIRWRSVFVVLVAFGIGLLLGEPRLVENGSAIGRRVFDDLGRERPIGTASLVAQLRLGLSLGVLALAAVGLVAAGRAAAGARGRVIVFTLPLLAAALLPGAGRTEALLLAPGIAILAAFALSRAPARWPRIVPAVLAAALLAVPGAKAVSEARRSAKGDSRDAAAAWLATNLPAGQAIAMDLYGPKLGADRVSFTLPFDSSRPEVYEGAYDPRWYEGFGAFVLVGSMEERYERAASRFARQLALRQSLRALCARAAFFGSEYLGPSIEVLVRRGETRDGAVASFVRSGAAPPVAPEFHLSLGGSYLRMGKLTDALALLEVASHAMPGDPRLAINLGGAYLASGDLMKADEVLREAVHQHPENPALRYQLGRVRESRRLFGDAIAEYKMAVRANPAYAEAHLGLAYAYLGAGNDRAALGAAERARQLAPAGRVHDDAGAFIRALLEASQGAGSPP